MHRTQGEDFDPDVYQDATNKRGYRPASPPLINATRLPAESMNAIQEEMCNLIETVGMGLEPDAAADRANGWNQLYQAIFQMSHGTSLMLAMNSVHANRLIDATLTAAKLNQSTIMAPLSTTIPGSGVVALRLNYNSDQLEAVDRGDGLQWLQIKTNGVTAQELLYDAEVFTRRLSDNMLTLANRTKRYKYSETNVHTTGGTAVFEIGPGLDVGSFGTGANEFISATCNISGYLAPVGAGTNYGYRLGYRVSYSYDSGAGTAASSVDLLGRSSSNANNWISEIFEINKEMIDLRLEGTTVYNITRIVPIVEMTQGSLSTMKTIVSAGIVLEDNPL